MNRLARRPTDRRTARATASSHPARSSQSHDDEEQADERHRRHEAVNRRLQFLRRLQRESSLTARRASLPLRPRPLRAVVDVSAPLAHPQLTVHVVRLARDGGRRRRALRLGLEPALRRRRARGLGRGLLPEQRPRLRVASRRALFDRARARVARSVFRRDRDTSSPRDRSRSSPRRRDRAPRARARATRALSAP